MTSWLQAIAPFIVALLILGVPGACVMAALRVRGFAALALAPAISVSIIAVSAVVAPMIHLPWNWPVVALGTAITTAGVYAARRYIPVLTQATDPACNPSREKPGSIPATLIGVGTALAITTTVLLLNAHDPEQFTQGYDSVFHLNATEFAVQQQNASSFGISDFISATPNHGFYPAAWHGLTSLLIAITGISVPAATNVMWLAVAGVLWPLACVFLTRILFGSRPSLMAAAGALAVAFPSFPYMLLHYGSAYPNTLSNALVPIGVGLVLLIIRANRHKLLEPPLAFALVILYLPGTVVAQPNGIFSIILVVLPLLLWMLFEWAKKGWQKHPAISILRVVIAFALAVLIVWALFLLPQIRSLFNYTSPAFTTFWAGLWRSFSFAPWPVWFPAIALMALVITGIWQACKKKRQYWLLGSFVIIVLCYPTTVGSNDVFFNAVLAPWWDNPERISALLPLVGVPLAALGLTTFMSSLSKRFLYRLWWLGSGGTRLAGVVLLALAVTFSNPGLWQISGAVGRIYNVPQEPDNIAQVDAQELALIKVLDQYTTPEDVIANNPYNGSALAMGLAGRTMLFSYSSQVVLSPDQYTLRFWLNRVGSDQSVCAAAKRLGVTYLLDFGTDYIPAFDNPRSLYPGITLAAGSEGFTLVAKEGQAALYKLTLCAGSPLPAAK